MCILPDFWYKKNNSESEEWSFYYKLHIKNNSGSDVGTHIRRLKMKTLRWSHYFTIIKWNEILSNLLCSRHSKPRSLFQNRWHVTTSYRWPLVILYLPWFLCMNELEEREWSRVETYPLIKKSNFDSTCYLHKYAGNRNGIAYMRVDCGFWLR